MPIQVVRLPEFPPSSTVYLEHSSSVAQGEVRYGRSFSCGTVFKIDFSKLMKHCHAVHDFKTDA